MMIKKTFIHISFFLLLLLIISGCSKDKFATKPSLKFKSISSYDIPNQGLFEIRLEYTDAEGDLRLDSGLTIRRTILRCASDSLRITYKLPEIPQTKNSSGDIVIRFASNTVNYVNQGYATYPLGPCNFGGRPDTTLFRFYIRDRAGNVSDTVSVDKPIIFRR